MHKPRLLAALIGLLGSTSALATGPTGAVFFGDSLTDSGLYAPFLPPGAGRFTTNPGPVWAEVFAAQHGWNGAPVTQGGSNFAAGGARVTQLPGIPPSPPTDNAPPLRTQISNYLAMNGGVAQTNSLHFVWAGANDIFFIAPTPAAATAYLQQTTAEAAVEIGRLAAAGARYIVVMNVPDIGATPFGQSQGAAGAAGLTQLSSGYNNLLFGSLAAGGVQVLALDTFSLLREIQADPQRYGFTNASLPACGATPSLLCTEANLIAPGASETFVFADGVHPTTGAHRVIAEFADGMLAVPGQIGQMPEMAVRNQIALSRQLWRNAAINLGSAEIGSLTGWASVSGGSTEVNKLDASPFALTVGLERRNSDATMAGAALSFNRAKPDWGDTGGYKLQDYSLSVYGGYRADALSLAGSLSFAKLDYDSDRHMRLGSATRTMRGDTDGSRFAAGVQLAYALEHGALSHGPVASLLHQRVTVTEFDERASDGSVSTRLSYDMQKRKSTVLSAGWQATYQAGAWAPYGAVMLNHDFQAKSRTLRLRTSASDAWASLPTVGSTKTYASVSLGALAKLGDRALVDINLDAVPRRKSLEDTRLTASLRMPF